MSTTQHTGHYNLPTFGDNPNDRPSWRGDFTDAMTKIDNQMYANATNITTATAAANNAKTAADEAKEAASGAQSALDSFKTTTNASITALQSKDTQTDSAIAGIGANLTALGADSVSNATAAKTKWDNTAKIATYNAQVLVALDAETTEKATVLKNTVNGHTTDIADIKANYATKNYVDATCLKHANIAVAKGNEVPFSIALNSRTPQAVTFSPNDGTTSFNDSDGAITLSSARNSMEIHHEGIYLVSAESRFGSITFSSDESYRGMELLLYINDALAATAPAGMVVGGNGTIRGAQYSVLPCRPYKLAANDKISLKYRLNGATAATSGTINYIVLSVFRIAK